MSTIRAVVVDPTADGNLSIAEVPYPQPKPNEALIRVKAISLNRGEVRRIPLSEAGSRPGWEAAGIVEQAAADGTGPKAGERVLAMMRTGGWGEVIAAPTNIVGTLPDTVTFEQASTLPVAGLTALYAVEKNGALLARNVLLTGASGGVGHTAVQLAHHAGAFVVAHVRQEERAALVKDAGADVVLVGDDMKTAAPYAPYYLIADAIGGQPLADIIGYVSLFGMIVAYGGPAGNQVSVNLEQLRGGGKSIYGLSVFYESTREPASGGLTRLARLIADGALKPHIALSAPWTEIAQVARQYWERAYPGKVVLTL